MARWTEGEERKYKSVRVEKCKSAAAWRWGCGARNPTSRSGDRRSRGKPEEPVRTPAGRKAVGVKPSLQGVARLGSIRSERGWRSPSIIAGTYDNYGGN